MLLTPIFRLLFAKHDSSDSAGNDAITQPPKAYSNTLGGTIVQAFAKGFESSSQAPMTIGGAWEMMTSGVQRLVSTAQNPLPIVKSMVGAYLKEFLEGVDLRHD